MQNYMTSRTSLTVLPSSASRSMTWILSANLCACSPVSQL